LPSSIPVGVRERGAVEAGGKRVGRERAHAALDVAAVEGGLARERAADEIALVDCEARNSSGVDGAGREGEGGEGGLEEHVDGVFWLLGNVD